MKNQVATRRQGLGTVQGLFSTVLPQTSISGGYGESHGVCWKSSLSLERQHPQRNPLRRPHDNVYFINVLMIVSKPGDKEIPVGVFPAPGLNVSRILKLPLIDCPIWM